MTVEAEMLITSINHFGKYQFLTMLLFWCAYNVHREGQTDELHASVWDRGGSASTYLLLAIWGLIYPFVVTF